MDSSKESEIKKKTDVQHGILSFPDINSSSYFT